MAWLPAVLAVLCLAIGLFHLVRAIPPRAARERLLEIGYAAMGLGMAGMYSPLGDPVPAPVWALLFLFVGGWFGAAMARARSVAVLGGEALHLLVGSVAMLFMLAADQRAAGPAGGHAAHTMGGPGLAGAASAVALVFAAYFVLHTLRCADRLRAARVGAGVCVPPATVPAGAAEPAPAPVEACAPPAAALAHLLMTITMAIMLIGMI